MTGGEMNGGVERRSGVDRREDWGRVVYSRGPIIRTLEIVNAVTGVLALVAIVVAIVLYGVQVGRIQQERWRSSVATCYSIRMTALDAVPDNQPYMRAVLRRAGLGDCVGNAQRITGLSQSEAR